MFHSAQVEPLLQKDYVVVAVDVGEFDHNIDLASKYVDLQTSGIPALVVLQPDGTLRTATNDGSFANVHQRPNHGCRPGQRVLDPLGTRRKPVISPRSWGAVLGSITLAVVILSECGTNRAPEPTGHAIAHGVTVSVALLPMANGQRELKAAFSPLQPGFHISPAVGGGSRRSSSACRPR